MASSAVTTMETKVFGVRSCWLWLITYSTFLIGLALFIPSAFSATWVTIPANSSSSQGNHLSAGLWTDCNSTTHICDDYNAAYLDASAALVIVAAVMVFISGLLHMMPWLASIAQIITGFVSFIAVIVFCANNNDLTLGWSVPMFSTALVIFLLNGIFSFLALGYPELKRISGEGSIICKDLKTCCYCRCCNVCRKNNAVHNSDVELNRE